MSLLLPAEATTVERWTSRLNACENTKEEPLLALLVDKWGAYRGIAVTLCAPEPLRLLSSDPPLPFDLLTSFFCSHLWSYQVSPTIDAWSAWMWLVVQPCGCRRLRAALVPNGLSFCKKKTVIYRNLFLCGKKKTAENSNCHKQFFLFSCSFDPFGFFATCRFSAVGYTDISRAGYYLSGSYCGPFIPLTMA